MKILIIFVVWGHVEAQSTIIVPKNKYGISVIQTKQLLQQTIQQDSNKEMIDISRLIPSIIIDLPYAGKNNFTHEQLYPSNTTTTFLRQPAARALQKIQQELLNQHYCLKIFDAYRPYSVTEKFWQLIHDERYVAKPTTASGHNKGISVDVTIVDYTNNKELNMGTGFDNFTDSAHHDFTRLPDKVLENRKLLKNIMIKYGFKSLQSEWWHYSWAGTFEPLDVSFADLKDLQK